MNSYTALLMVKIYQADSNVGISRDELDRLDNLWLKCLHTLAARGFVRSTSLRKLSPYEYLKQFSVSSDSALEAAESLDAYSRDFVERVSELAEIFGIKLTEEERDLEFLKYSCLSLVGDIIPQLKYATNLVFTRFMSVEEPPGNDRFWGLHVFPRRFQVLLHRMIRSRDRERRSRKSMILMNTILQGFKRSLMPIDPPQIEKSLLGLEKDLTSTPIISEFFYEEISEKTCELLSNWESPTVDTHNQSASATTLSSYSNGGNIGHVRRALYCLNKEGVVSMQIGERQLVGFVCKNNEPTKVYAVYQTAPIQLNDLLNFFQNRIYLSPTMSCGEEDLPVLEAVPACILEPMKVRIITKPSTGLHVRMTKIQKSLWEFLRRFNCFPLIGEEIEKEHLGRFFIRGWNFGDFMVSGDYSSATNKLKGGASEAAIKVITDRFLFKDPRLAENLRNSLLGLQINLCDMKMPDYGSNALFGAMNYSERILDGSFQQQSGQLMGHVVSFVVLCILNLVCYWISRELEHQRKIPFDELLEQFPVLVNGDDILFKTNSRHYEIWKECCQGFGFELSQGKNYCSDKFCLINSTLFQFSFFPLKVADLPPTFEYCLRQVERIPYINMGFITNRRKNDCSKDLSIQRIGFGFDEVDEDSLLGRLKSLYPIFSKLTDGIPSLIQDRVLPIYKKHIFPMLLHFNMQRYWRKLNCVSDEQIRRIIRSERCPDALMMRPLKEMASRLDRGALRFDFRMNREMAKLDRIKEIQNPFALWDFDGLCDLPEIAEPEWTRTNGKRMKVTWTKERLKMSRSITVVPYGHIRAKTVTANVINDRYPIGKPYGWGKVLYISNPLQYETRRRFNDYLDSLPDPSKHELME